MKILLTHSDPELPARESIDLWRIIRPFKELAKHVDWQIDHQPYLIDPKLISKKTSKVQTDKLVKELERLGQYDIVWTSYFPDATLFDCMMFMSQKFGTKFVLDVDDNMYEIPKTNTIWKDKNAAKNIKEMQYMIEHTPYLVTSSRILQQDYKLRRTNPTYFLPNYISEEYKHKPFDNGDKIVVGFFGGAAHEQDFKASGALQALKLLIKDYKNIHVGSVGMKLDLPKDRYTFYPGKPGQAWIDEVWPNINIDISLAPLEDNVFNRCKTNIKWLESALIPAAFVATGIPPYSHSVKQRETGLLVQNTTEQWYNAIEELVTNQVLRHKLATHAESEVRLAWSIEHKWDKVKALVETIQKDNTAKLP